MKVMIEASVGELIDKTTILEIKLRNIKDPLKWANCQRDWRQLCEVLVQVEVNSFVYINGAGTDRMTERYFELTRNLRAVNQKLWNIEDEIRALERKNVAFLLEGNLALGTKHIIQDAQFYKDGKRFVELARAVYVTNDERCRLKKELDALFGSELTEEKSYQEIK